MGRPTFLVATVLLLLLGVPFCGSSATIPQPPPVTTRHKRSSWSEAAASFFGRSPITLSSRNNNVVADADDADGTMVPSSSRPPLITAMAAAEDHPHQHNPGTVGLYGERVRKVLSLCVVHISASVAMFDAILSTKIGADVADGTMVPPPPSLITAETEATELPPPLITATATAEHTEDTSLSSDNESVAADTDDDAAVPVGPLPPSLITATATATVEHTEDTTLSSKNGANVADTDDDAAVPVGPLPPSLITATATATVEHTEDTTLSSKNGANVADFTLVPPSAPPPLITAMATAEHTEGIILFSKNGADVADFTLVHPPPPLITAETEVTEQVLLPPPLITATATVERTEDTTLSSKNGASISTMMICACCRCFFVLSPNWPQALFYLLNDVEGLNMVQQFGRDLHTNLRQRYQQPTMVYTLLQSLCGQRPGQHEKVPTLITFVAMIVLFVIAFVFDFVVMAYTMRSTGRHVMPALITFVAMIVRFVIAFVISFVRHVMPTLITFVAMIVRFVIAFVISFVVMAYTMVQYLWAQRPFTGPPTSETEGPTSNVDTSSDSHRRYHVSS